MMRPFGPMTASLVAVVLGVGIAGCSTADVDKLKDAQSAFNDAATADNQVRLGAYAKLGGAADGAGDASLGASTGYARAVAILKGLSPKETEQLQGDKLWGVALTIEALSYWRLKDYDHADATASMAKGLPADQLYPRDRAMVAAMPGLIKISEANDRIFLPDKSPLPPQARAQAANDLLTSAIADLDAAIAGAAPNDPVYVYLLQAELSAYRNKEDAAFYLAQPGKVDGKLHVVPLPAAEAAHAQCRLSELEDAITTNASGDMARPILAFWGRVLGMMPNAAACS